MKKEILSILMSILVISSVVIRIHAAKRLLCNEDLMKEVRETMTEVPEK
ncbi:hypothetical protein TNCT_618331, partial [Trichonephila clavata]